MAKGKNKKKKTEEPQEPPRDLDELLEKRYHFLVVVTSEGLTTIADLLDSGQLTKNVGEVLPLAEARLAHEMLAGKPHKRGKIVLEVDA